jgi:hypothetical protein
VAYTGCFIDTTRYSAFARFSALGGVAVPEADEIVGFDDYYRTIESFDGRGLVRGRRNEISAPRAQRPRARPPEDLEGRALLSQRVRFIARQPGMIVFRLSQQSLEQAEHVFVDLGFKSGNLQVVDDLPLANDTLAALLDVLLREREQIFMQQHYIPLRYATVLTVARIKHPRDYATAYPLQLA